MRNAKKASSLLALVLLMASWAEAAQSVRIWGRIVLRGNGRPAIIRIQLHDLGLTTLETYTRDGRFEFQNVPPGPYEVWLEAAGYEPSMHTITILGNQEFVLEMRSTGKEFATRRQCRHECVAENCSDC